MLFAGAARSCSFCNNHIVRGKGQRASGHLHTTDRCRGMTYPCRDSMNYTDIRACSYLPCKRTWETKEMNLSRYPMFWCRPVLANFIFCSRNHSPCRFCQVFIYISCLWPFMIQQKSDLISNTLIPFTTIIPHFAALCAGCNIHLNHATGHSSMSSGKKCIASANALVFSSR